MNSPNVSLAFLQQPGTGSRRSSYAAESRAVLTDIVAKTKQETFDMPILDKPSHPSQHNDTVPEHGPSFDSSRQIHEFQDGGPAIAPYATRGTSKMMTEPVSTADADLLLGLHSPFSAFSHAVPGAYSSHYEETRSPGTSSDLHQGTTTITRIQPANPRAPLDQISAMQPNQQPQHSSTPRHMPTNSHHPSSSTSSQTYPSAPYMANSEFIGDMVIDTQDIDMSALGMGGDMMPWLEYLPQDLVDWFDYSSTSGADWNANATTNVMEEEGGRDAAEGGRSKAHHHGQTDHCEGTAAAMAMGESRHGHGKRRDWDKPG